MTDGFSQIPLIDKQTLQQIFTRKNYFNSYSCGITQSYSFNMAKWWEGSVEANVYYTYTKIFRQFENYIPAQNGYGSNFTVNNNFIINKEKDFLMEINCSYNSASRFNFVKINSFMSLDAGIKKSFSKKRFQIAINITDIFKTSAPDFTIYTNGVKQVYNTYYDDRQLKFSVKYAFGNNKISVKQREFGNETERRRIK